MKTIKDASFSQMMLKGALVFCLRETDDAVRTTFQQYTELFQSIHCYAAVVAKLFIIEWTFMKPIIKSGKSDLLGYGCRILA